MLESFQKFLIADMKKILFPLQPNNYAQPDSMEIVFTALSSVCIIVNIVIISFIIKKWNNMIILASSPLFCIFILIGTSLAYVTVIMNTQYPPTDAICMSIPYIAHLAFAIVFGSLFAKTYRVAMIFQLKGLDGRRMSNEELLKRVGVFIMLTILYLGLWHAFSPSRANIRVISNTKYLVCASDNQFWPNFILAAEGMILFYGLYLAYLARNNPFLFNESKFILIIIMQLATVGGLTVLLSKIIHDAPNRIIIIENLGYLVISNVIVIGLFAPKLHRILSDKGKNPKRDMLDHEIDAAIDKNADLNEYPNEYPNANPQHSRCVCSCHSHKLPIALNDRSFPHSNTQFKTENIPHTPKAIPTTINANNLLVPRDTNANERIPHYNHHNIKTETIARVNMTNIAPIDGNTQNINANPNAENGSLGMNNGISQTGSNNANNNNENAVANKIIGIHHPSIISKISKTSKMSITLYPSGTSEVSETYRNNDNLKNKDAHSPSFSPSSSSPSLSPSFPLSPHFSPTSSPLSPTFSPTFSPTSSPAVRYMIHSHSPSKAFTSLPQSIAVLSTECSSLDNDAIDINHTNNDNHSNVNHTNVKNTNDANHATYANHATDVNNATDVNHATDVNDKNDTSHVK